MLQDARSRRTKTRIARERAEAVACPTCAAPPGDHCASATGGRMSPHAGRVRLAKGTARKEQTS